VRPPPSGSTSDSYNYICTRTGISTRLAPRHQSNTMMSVYVGTVNFMSPEMQHGEDYNQPVSAIVQIHVYYPYCSAKPTSLNMCLNHK